MTTKRSPVLTEATFPNGSWMGVARVAALASRAALGLLGVGWAWVLLSPLPGVLADLGCWQPTTRATPITSKFIARIPVFLCNPVDGVNGQKAIVSILTPA